jgi:cytochrome c
MNSYRFNQIAMAVLGALLLIFGTRTIVKIAFEEHESEKPGYEVAGAKKPGAEQPGGEAAQGGDQILVLLAKADPAKGAEVAKKCQLCHSFDKGGPNLIGPNLYGVLGHDIASHEGYEYSEQLKALPGNWDYVQINSMVEHPNVFVPGTKMALFQGLPDAKQRAEVLAFLRTKNDNPPPLPEAGAAGGEAASGKTAAGEATPEAAKPAGEGGEDVVVLLAHADAVRGAEVAKKCQICHSFDKGGPNLIGPNLYGVLGRDVASHEGYEYSDALKAKGGKWDFASINAMITSPTAYAPGTKMMLFQGLPDAKQRGDILLFLRTKNDSPPPLPEAAAGGGAAPSAETPAAPKAEEPAPSAETPAPSAETPAPSAETPAAPEAEEPAPAAETPAAPAPAAETPAAQAPAPAPSAETPAPSAETPAAPKAEEPAPSAETPAPSAETPAAPAEDSAPDPLAGQPQPVYPDGPPEN